MGCARLCRPQHRSGGQNVEHHNEPSHPWIALREGSGPAIPGTARASTLRCLTPLACGAGRLWRAVTPEEAVVLAGGLGKRLRPVVSDVPKPLAPVAGRPFLHWLLDGLARRGLGRVVLAIGHMGEAVRSSIGPAHAGMEIGYAQDERPLGTGGATWSALELCTGERVFVLNGDTWLGAALAPMAAEAPAADVVLAVHPVANRARYGGVRLDGNRVLGLEEKGLVGPGLVNAGLYLLRRDLPARRPMPRTFSLEREVLANPGELNIRGYHADVPFIDIGTPEDFAAAQALLPRWAASSDPLGPSTETSDR
jgi:D-glycero-alpha-D-manno-heptose 1-phosphate guanylyltransferase